MKKALKTSVTFLALASCLTFAALNVKKEEKEGVQVFAGDKTISDSSFVRVNNFLNSGKGFLMEFGYTLPSVTETMSFSFMDFGSAWHRLTERFTMTFKNDGTVACNIGHVFEIDGNYYFELMFSELGKYLNKGSGEVAYGTETLDGMYISDDVVSFTVKNTQLISTGMNAYPVSEIRNDATPGLTFKAYTPEIVKNAKYGMVIIPSNRLYKINGDYRRAFYNEGSPYIDVECSPVELEKTDPIYKSFGKGYSFKASIINIKEENYQVPFVAIPYYELDGVTTYANLVRSTKTTYYKKCLEFRKSASFAGAHDTVKYEVDKVIYKCEHHVTNVKLDGIKAYFKYNTEKIFKNAALPEELVTENVMYAARNETERGQVIINVPSDFDKNYFASFEPFVNSKNPNEVIGLENIKIDQQLYQNVNSNWSVGKDQPKKWYPDNKPIYDLPLGYIPDALLPFDIAFDSNKNRLSGVNGPNNALSFTIKVPKGVSAGEYKSKIVIKISDRGTLALPVTLNVFDFTMPEENKNREIIIVNTGETGALYGKDAGELSSIYNQSAYDMLKERHISGGQIPESYWATSDVTKYISKAKEYALDKNIGAYFLPNCSKEVSLTIGVKKNQFKSEDIVIDNLLVYRADDIKYDETIKLPGIKTVLRELVKASTNEADLLKKAVYYFPQADEPGGNLAKQMQNILCQNVVLRCIDELLLEDGLFTGKDKVKESLKHVGYVVTAYPKDALDGSYYQSITSVTPATGFEDICKVCYCDSIDAIRYTTMRGYCPTYDSYQHDIEYVAKSGYNYLINHINDPDFTIWWYSCIQPITPYPSYFINANLIQKRVNSWTMYDLGIKGELYYMCNRTQRYANEISTPLTEEQILDGYATYEGTFGDGNLLYPVHNMFGEIDSSLYWISSLRLDNFAEAIDDYNYIAYADELINKLSSDRETYKDKLNTLLKSVQDGPGRNTTDVEFFNNQRIKLGNLVAQLANK